MSEIETSAAERMALDLESIGGTTNGCDAADMIRALLIERDSFKRIAGKLDAMISEVAAERDALAARLEKAQGQAGQVLVPRDLLAEAAVDIAGSVRAEYGDPPHPAMQWRYERDMEIVHRLRSAVAAEPPEAADG